MAVADSSRYTRWRRVARSMLNDLPEGASHLCVADSSAACAGCDHNS